MTPARPKRMRPEAGKHLNTYADPDYARAYATLELANTYYLAYRDLPEILARHCRGRRAIDFGCGAGRSTRFLRELGFEAIGVDVSEGMIERARGIDPSGDYRLVVEGRLEALGTRGYDLVLSAFTFDNIPGMARKIAIFRQLEGLLDAEGRIVHLVSAPEIYRHEWASFSTKGFPENQTARSGDTVRIVITDIEDARPVADVVCSDADYREVFQGAGLEVDEAHRPLATGDEPFEWVNETRISPWVIYALKRAGGAFPAP